MDGWIRVCLKNIARRTPKRYPSFPPFSSGHGSVNAVLVGLLYELMLSLRRDALVSVARYKYTSAVSPLFFFIRTPLFFFMLIFFFTVFSLQGGGFNEDLLDFALAGPKMRKWYGQEDALPSELIKDKKGGEEGGDDEDPEISATGEIILVLDADTDTGLSIITQLVLCRVPIRAVARKTDTVKTQFGPYCQVLSGDMSNPRFAQMALKGVRAIVSPGKTLVTLPEAARSAGVEHVVLLASRGEGSGLFGFGPSNDIAQPNSEREASCTNSGIATTVLRVGGVEDRPGTGNVNLRVSTGGEPAKGGGSSVLSRDDIAEIASMVAIRRAPGNTEIELTRGSSSTDDVTDRLAALGYQSVEYEDLEPFV